MARRTYIRILLQKRKRAYIHLWVYRVPQHTMCLLHHTILLKSQTSPTYLHLRLSDSPSKVVKTMDTILMTTNLTRNGSLMKTTFLLRTQKCLQILCKLTTPRVPCFHHVNRSFSSQQMPTRIMRISKKTIYGLNQMFSNGQSEVWWRKIASRARRQDRELFMGIRAKSGEVVLQVVVVLVVYIYALKACLCHQTHWVRVV